MNGLVDMSGNLALQTETAPLLACTVSRDVEDYDLLIEDMEAALGESWGDLTFDEALSFIGQDEAKDLQFIAVAVDLNDTPRLKLVEQIIKFAKSCELKVILIANDLVPAQLHNLMRAGADDFVPYPLPEDALAEAIARIRSFTSSTDESPQPSTPYVEPQKSNTMQNSFASESGSQEAVVLGVHGLAGGTGATTLAVNLAWELAKMDAFDTPAPSVCIIDLDLQFGSVSTYLDLPRKSIVLEIMAECAEMDEQAFLQGISKYNDLLNVFTAPSDIVPLDYIGPDEVSALIELAKSCFDVVIIDMPTTVMNWTETVIAASDMYFGVFEMELRSAQNVLRMIRALRDEDLPLEKVAYVLNKVPQDMSSKSRVSKMAESLGVDFRAVLPEGNKQISEANDHGLPLAEAHPKITYRKEVLTLAESIWGAAIGIDTENEKSTKSRGLFSFGR